MRKFNLDIATPMKELVVGEVTYLRAPGVDGLFGIMAGHRNSVFAIDIGGVKVVKDGESVFFASGSGFLEFSENKAQLLVETIEQADEINIERAESAMKRAKDRLSERDDRVDRERAEAALARAVNRLQTANMLSR